MKNNVLFPLRAAKIFSKDPKDTFESLDRIIKNALLFYDEVWFEGGAHQVSYGDIGNFSMRLPYKGKEEYSREKAKYSAIGSSKRDVSILMKPNVPGAQWSPPITSPARNYYVSFVGELELLTENFSPRELEFIIFFRVDNATKLESEIRQFVKQKERKLAGDLSTGLRTICDKWDIDSKNGNLILRETIDAIFLARALNAPPVFDELHMDVIELSNILEKASQENTRLETLSKVMDIAVPDYGSLSMEKILELRKDPSIQAFRRVVTDISSKLIGTPVEDIHIAQEVIKELLRDMNDIQPSSQRKVILSATADCLLAIPSPFQIFGLIKDLITAQSDIRKIERWETSFGCFLMKLVV